eukprot:6169084-Prymnesium_polylepis.1
MSQERLGVVRSDFSSTRARAHAHTRCCVKPPRMPEAHGRLGRRHTVIATRPHGLSPSSAAAARRGGTPRQRRPS